MPSPADLSLDRSRDRRPPSRPYPQDSETERRQRPEQQRRSLPHGSA